MNYKQNRDGTYDCFDFRASDLPVIIRMVKQGEIWKIEEAQAALTKIEEAENEITPNEIPDEQGNTPNN